jgi:DNA polymerase-1
MDVRRIVLIDGYSFVFRAYHSMPPLSNPEGVIVGALYGYSNMVFKVRESLQASHFAVVFDHGSKSFRNEIYKEYKANRPPAPEDLIAQFPLVREVTAAMNIAALEQEAVEADDIIATIAKKAEDKNIEVTIISSDKDLMQLVTDKVKLYDPMKQKIIGTEQVFAKFGVYPSKIRDLLSLAGDSADNIPGVPSIGPKTAAELLNKYDSLEGIYANIEDIAQPKRKKVLLENKGNAYLSQKLVTLKTNLKLIEDLEQIKLQEIDQEKLANFYHKHGFNALLSKLDGKFQVKKTTNKTLLQLSEINNGETAEIILEKLQQEASLFIINLDDDILISTNKKIYIFKIGAAETIDLLVHPSGISREYITEKICDIISDKTIEKYLYDAKEFYKNYLPIDRNIEPQNIMEIKILRYLLSKDDNEIFKKDLTYEKTDIANIITEIIAEKKDLLQKVILDNQANLLYNLDLPFNQLLFKMQQAGFKISINKLQQLTDEFSKAINELSSQIFELAGEEFNIGSPKQLGVILFEKMGIESNKKSKKSKNSSTSQEVLEELSEAGHIIAEKILKWRHFSKLKSTYTDSLPKQINNKTNRVHSSFSATTTSTGRISSNNPNLQNIPVRSKEGDKIRAAFICEAGNKLISADYSQIELRLLAHIAKVSKLKDAFKNDADIHAATASEVFGIAIDQVDSEFRRKAKAINFGIIYGISAYGLATRLKITNKDAKDFIHLYFSRYPEIKNYMEETIAKCKEQGFVETIFGRKLFFPNINASNPMLKNFTERAVINAPLQGSAADIVKKAMLDLDKEIKMKNLPMQLILQIHDELIYEVKEDFAAEAKDIVKKKMESVIKLDIPLIVDANIGANWQEIH